MAAPPGRGNAGQASLRREAPRGCIDRVALGQSSKPVARREVSVPRDCGKLDEALAVVAAIMIVGGWVSIVRDTFVFQRPDGATRDVHRPAAVVPALSLVLELRSGP